MEIPDIKSTTFTVYVTSRVKKFWPKTTNGVPRLLSAPQVVPCCGPLRPSRTRKSSLDLTLLIRFFHPPGKKCETTTTREEAKIKCPPSPPRTPIPPTMTCHWETSPRRRRRQRRSTITPMPHRFNRDVQNALSVRQIRSDDSVKVNTESRNGPRAK